VIARLQRASDALDRLVIGVCIACFLVMLSISFAGFFYQLITGAALSWTYSASTSPWRSCCASSRRASCS
jgi:hypothetical protein